MFAPPFGLHQHQQAEEGRSYFKTCRGVFTMGFQTWGRVRAGLRVGLTTSGSSPSSGNSPSSDPPSTASCGSGIVTSCTAHCVLARCR